MPSTTVSTLWRKTRDTNNFTRTSLPNLFDPSNNINSVKLVDLNGDGAIDLAFTATVYSGGGYGEADFGLFAAANSFSTFVATTSNSDNGTQYKILTLLNQGNGTFSTPSEYLVAEGISSLLSSDVNGDNREDLIVWGSGYTQLSVLISQGNGSFASQTAYDFSSPIDQVLSADLNQDGFKDLVVESDSANQVSVLLNNRDGSFAAPTNYSVSGSITFADISGDGSLDMLLANDQSSSVYMMRNQGNGTFGAVTGYKLEFRLKNTFTKGSISKVRD